MKLSVPNLNPNPKPNLNRNPKPNPKPNPNIYAGIWNSVCQKRLPKQRLKLAGPSLLHPATTPQR